MEKIIWVGSGLYGVLLTPSKCFRFRVLGSRFRIESRDLAGRMPQVTQILERYGG